MTYSDSAIEDGGPRPGRSGCECHYGPSSVHGPRPTRGGGFQFGEYPEVCERDGTMHGGWFICGPCVRHAPQLRRDAKP